MGGSELRKNFNMSVFDWISYIKVISYITLSEHTTWMNCLKIKKKINGSSYSETAIIALNVIYMPGYSRLGLCSMLYKTELKYYTATWDTEVGWCIHNMVTKCVSSEYVWLSNLHDPVFGYIKNTNTWTTNHTQLNSGKCHLTDVLSQNPSLLKATLQNHWSLELCTRTFHYTRNCMMQHATSMCKVH
jgi:Tfp pilus assembly protein PilV